MMDRKDILLALIYLPIDKKPEMMSPIQIMKALFLLKMELDLPDSEFYSFKPYLYGLCSFEVYSDLASLQEERLIDTEASDWGWKYYRLTDKGRNAAKEVVKAMDKSILEKLQRIKTIVMSKSFAELLRYVYTKYPEYAKMTLIIALACKNGIVMASDGQATGGSARGPIRVPVQKIYKINEHVLFGASGSVGVVQKTEK